MLNVHATGRHAGPLHPSYSMVLGRHMCSVQEENRLYGIDVTHSRFFCHPKVEEAVAFAAQAHKGQTRKTKEPYVAHCIATACIVEELLQLAEESAFSNSR